MRRTSWTLLCTLAALALTGCADSEAFDGAGGAGDAWEGAGGAGGGTADGAGGGRPTEGLQGLSPELFADPERIPPALDADAQQSYLALARDCYEGSSCGAEVCAVLAACCVGDGGCCSRVDSPALPAFIDFRSCEGLDVQSCAQDHGTIAVPFGPDAPLLSSRGLLANGNLFADGGAVLGAPVDLAAHRVDVAVQFTLPEQCGASCLESAGISWTEEDPSLGFDNGLGLVLSGSREELRLLVGETVVASFAAGSSDTVWTLSVEPDGHLEVRRDGVLQTRRSVEVSRLRRARLAVFGRNANEAAEAAAIATLGLEQALCDMPAAWETRSALSILDELGPRTEDSRGRGPSLASDGTETRLAYALDAELFWARRSSDPGEAQLIDTGPALTPVYPHEALGVRDPELVWDGSLWHLFYTAEDAKGLRHIGHATAAADALLFSAAPTPSLSPLPSWPEPSRPEVLEHLEQTGVIGFDAPTVYHREGLWVLIVRALLTDSGSELRAYYATGLSGAFNEDWAPLPASELARLTRIELSTEELTDPSLIVHNGAYQLYYARRRGTRWAIEQLSSDDLVAWRPLGEVLGGSGTGFDALGARGPDALAEGDRVQLLFDGHDGVAFSLGFSSRPGSSQSVQSP